MWKTVGHVLVAIGKGAVQAGLWASKHPEVVQAAATIAGHPEIAAAIGGVSAAVNKKMAAPAPTPTAAPPVVVDPQPTAPVEVEPTPEPAPDYAALEARVRVLYKDILNRSRSAITPAEMDEAVDLLRAGREDELINNLKGRA